MGPDRSVSRAAAALLALGALFSARSRPGAETRKSRSPYSSPSSPPPRTSSIRPRPRSPARPEGRRARAPADAAAAAAARADGTETARLAPVNADNPAISFVVDTQALDRTPGDDGVGFLLAHRRAVHLRADRPVPARLRQHQRHDRGGLRHRGGGAGDDRAALQPDREGRALLRRRRALPALARRGAAVRRPAAVDRAHHRRRDAGRGRRDLLARADRSVHPASRSALQRDRRRSHDRVLRHDAGGQPSFKRATYLVHPQTYFDLTDTLNLELGGTFLPVRRTRTRALRSRRHAPPSAGDERASTRAPSWAPSGSGTTSSSTTSSRHDATGEAILGSSASTATAATRTSRASSIAATRSGLRADYAEIPSASGAPAHLLGVRHLDAVGVPAPALAVRPDRHRRARRPALHAAVDRVHRESQPWLRDPLARARTRPRCLSARGGPAAARCASSRPLPDVADMTRQIGGDA